MRYSKQRELVQSIIKGRCDHPTADMIYAKAREIESSISLGTVYRNLKNLVDEGEIITLETSDKKIHYDGDLSEHSHFICNDCGKIIDLFEELPVSKGIKEKGLTLTSAKCFYYGKCKECSIKG